MTVRLLTGDALQVLRGLPADSVDCCVTSPPYWGLRDYDVEGQIGMEPTLGEHLAVMVEIFEEVRRVLKPTGTCWVNYGDCYATAPNGRSAADTKAAGNDDRTFRDKPFSTVGPVYEAVHGKGGYRGDSKRPNMAAPQGRIAAGGYLKPKDLCMLPNRLAIALQDAGWWVRSEIVWGKPNAMPDSSGNYRPSVSHEKIFLLTKSGDGDVWRARDSGEISFAPDLSERCPLITKPQQLGPRWVRLGAYFDADAVMLARTTASDGKQPDGWDTGPGGHGAFHRGGREKGKRKQDLTASSANRAGGSSGRRMNGFNARWDSMEADGRVRSGRLLRNFESDVAEMVPPDVMAWEIAIQGFSGAHFATFPPALVVPCVLAGCPAGGMVLDPFGGAGTTGMVAERLGRDAILIELNHDYARIAQDRLRAAMVRVESELAPVHKAVGDMVDIMRGEAA
ncbi:site-specific DNA-methyltransferase [Sphingobium sp. JS3065]|uniref:DNA-methyltransferase n=1 Tax=Sphingobium sp. JS3065 TaxID=2970925 RepID=UPI0022643E10|nr:site-specific DNA-methyltransferase [Sphingobium sp. JS3065]UZW55538.1 site-specific DNA-methyltransferase [Sphingobium sp. JS3065]